MNRIFNVIWSTAKEKWVVVSEKVKSNGGVPKSSLLSIAVLSSILAVGVPAYAVDPGELPAGGQITAGTGSIGASGTRMTVNQSSQQMIANWSSFNIGTDASVQFFQPNVSATALNHISDQNPTQILGSLSANGKVFLLNQSGIIFGKNARVDVGGLVASSLDMLDSDFLAARYKFNNSGHAGEIFNQGSINVFQGGVVALIGPKVTNEGAINANGGSVAMGAGNQVSLDLKGDGLITFTVDEGAVDALAENKGLVKADGGLVVMTARAADVLTQSAVNNSGIVQARSMEQKDGRILLDAVGGMTTVSGTLDASSTDGKGGQVVATGDRVLVKDGAHLTASGLTGGGEVLVGGNWQGKDTSIHQATGTVVESGALLEANATDNGNGGTVVAWSDVTNPLSVTRAYGTFQAKGGPNGGDGGRIETSGHWLDVAGISVSASSLAGAPGLWLLDPWNVEIAATLPISGTPYADTFEATGDSVILASDIQTSLSGNIYVSISTGSGGTPNSGNITVNGSIFASPTTIASLTLSAANNIIIHGGIGNSSGGTLNLFLNSGVESANGNISGDGTLNVSGVTTFNTIKNSASGIYSGTIIGSGSLVKTGLGTLELSGMNSYTGNTSIMAGVLQVSSIGNSGVSGNLGTSATFSIDGGTLRYTGVIASTDRSFFTSSVGSTIEVDSGVQLTISGTPGVNSTGGLIKSGTGTLTLSGSNTLPLGLSIDSGILSLGSANAIGTTGQISFLNTGILQFTNLNQSDISARLNTANNQKFKFDTNGQNVTFANAIISGSGGTLQKFGAGTLTLLGLNSYTGSTTITAGTLTIAGTGSLNSGAYAGAISNSGELVFNTSPNQILSGLISGIGGNLTQSGSGTLTLTNANNTYTGVTTITNGVLSVGTIGNGGAASNLGAASAGASNLVLGGGTLRYTGATAATDRAFTLTNSTTSLIDVTANNLTISGSSAATSGNLTKVGIGTLTLSGSNSYTGSTTISAGTLTIGGSGSLGSGAYAGAISNSGELVFNTSANQTLSGLISGIIGNLTQSGSGTLTLTNANNTYTGVTTITNGVLSVGTIGNGGAASNLGAASAGASNLVLGGGTLRYTGATAATDRAFTLTNSTTSLVDVTANNLTISGSSAATSGNLTKAGAGTLTLSGSNNYTGSTTINGGAIRASSNTALGTVSGGVTVASGAALELDNNVTIGAEQLTLSGTGIGGGGALRSVSGNNTYQGAITLGADTYINADAATTLTLTNTINGAYGLSLNGGGTITLGGAVGGSTPLTSLTGNVSLLNINGGVVTTTGSQTYNGRTAFTFAGVTTLATVNNNIIATATDDAGKVTAVSGNTLTFNTGSGNVTFTNVYNDFSTVNFTNAGEVSLVDSNQLTISGINASGKIDVATMDKDLTVSGNIHTDYTGDNISDFAITLNAGKVWNAGTSSGGDIIVVDNGGSSPAISSGGFARFYTGSVSGSGKGSAGSRSFSGVISSGRFRYNSDEQPNPNYTKELESGLNAIYREQVKITVNPNSQTIEYGQPTPSFTAVYSPFANGDDNTTISGSAAWEVGGLQSSSSHDIAGLHDVSYTGGLKSSLGYEIINNASSINELTITQRTLSLNLLVAESKSYDGKTIAKILDYGVLQTVESPDHVSLYTNDSSANFNNKNAGTGKTVTVSGLALSGDDSGNYKIADQTTTANISKITLLLDGLQVDNKPYDGTVSVQPNTIHYSSVSNIVPGESITPILTGTFDTKDAGTNKTVTVSLGLSVSDEINYVFQPNTSPVHADIIPASLTVSANDAIKFANRSPYSGGNGVVFHGFVPGENISNSNLSGTLEYSGSSQGALESGMYVITPGGYSSSNYHITYADGQLTIISSVPTPPEWFLSSPPSSPPATLVEVNVGGKTQSNERGLPDLTSMEALSGNAPQETRVFMPEEFVRSSSSFIFPLPENVHSQLLTSMGPENVFLQDESPLPGWLKYDVENKVFRATDVPPGAIPVTVLVKQGNLSWRVVIVQ